ncbi:MAG: hypothetical protein K6F84_01815, partial [Lachnospiraceae bacterium]|nr:hypothetical protein [Lachnospiraceae bacterium]
MNNRSGKKKKGTRERRHNFHNWEGFEQEAVFEDDFDIDESEYILPGEEGYDEYGYEISGAQSEEVQYTADEEAVPEVSEPEYIEEVTPSKKKKRLGRKEKNRKKAEVASENAAYVEETVYDNGNTADSEYVNAEGASRDDANAENVSYDGSSAERAAYDNVNAESTSYDNSAYDAENYEAEAYEDGTYEDGTYEDGTYEDAAYEDGASYEGGIFDEEIEGEYCSED